jgi:hypothetical protein
MAFVGRPSLSNPLGIQAVVSLRDTYRRLRYGQPIIVVSGLPRSGTSMAMKMLQAGGLPLVTDGQREADEDNPKGYFEFEPVMNLARDDDKSWLAGAHGKGVKIISTLLRELPADHNYRVVFMRRDLQEILASQAKMLERREEGSDIDDERMLEVFENDLWRAGYLLENGPQFRVLPVHYTEVLAQPLEQARRLAAFLGGNLDIDKMAAVADPDLYRNRAANRS